MTSTPPNSAAVRCAPLLAYVNTGMSRDFGISAMRSFFGPAGSLLPPPHAAAITAARAAATRINRFMNALLGNYPAVPLPPPVV